MDQNKMNVLIIGLDSVSFPHLKRIFPQTYKYLSRDLANNLIFENLHILGENTFPNLVALFAGLIREENVDLGVRDETLFFSDILKQGTHHDLYPFVWDDLGLYENYLQKTLHNFFFETENQLKILERRGKRIKLDRMSLRRLNQYKLELKEDLLMYELIKIN